MLRVIGDIHGQIDFVLRRGRQTYLDIIADCKHSVQVGDMGDAETYAELESQVDARHHRFFPGNHDHYDSLPGHTLGDFGLHTLGGVEFFFVRGARSGDKKKLVRVGRQLGRTLWFEEEELSAEQLALARDAYVASRPAIMLSHASPSHITTFVHDYIRGRDPHQIARNARPSPTTEMFVEMLDLHRPKVWCFGHHHHDWHYNEDGTDFYCVGELSYLDIEIESGVPIVYARF